MMKLHLEHNYFTRVEQDGAAVVHEMIYCQVEPAATRSGHYLARLSPLSSVAMPGQIWAQSNSYLYSAADNDSVK